MKDLVKSFIENLPAENIIYVGDKEPRNEIPEPDGNFVTPEEVYQSKKEEILFWLKVMLELRDGEVDMVVFTRNDNGSIHSDSFKTAEKGQSIKEMNEQD